MWEIGLALGGLFALAIGSGLVPFLALEAALVALVAFGPGVPWWLAAVTAAIGQLIGKASHLLAADRIGTLPAVRDRIEGVVQRCQGRPRTAAGLVLLSSSVGLPPFAAVVPAVGLSGIPWRPLVPLALLGRTARFLVLAGVPALLIA